MTPQEIFNKVAEHLLKQNKKSLDEEGGCAYRGAQDTQCAVGCLITDKNYRPDMEGRAYKSIEVQYALKQEGIENTQVNIDLLEALQHLHDMYYPHEWPEKLDRVALLQGLLPLPDKQAIFDKVVKHLRGQNERSIDKTGKCMYRGNYEMMCAVGCLIRDEDYRPEMEGTMGNLPPEALKYEVPNMTSGVYGMLYDLQGIHDVSALADWEKGFEGVAYLHKLKYTAPEVP